MSEATTEEMFRRSDYAMGYVHASEGARLDYERRFFPVPVRPSWWQHLQSYQPWSSEEAGHHAATASQCLYRHDHGGDMSNLARENCGACVLSGWQPARKRDRDPEHDVDRDGPNYSGWARIYVEARRPIPSKWREAFANQGQPNQYDAEGNRAYYDALGRSVVTFGVTFGA